MTIEELLGPDWRQRLHQIVAEVAGQKQEKWHPSKIDVDNWRRARIDGLRFKLHDTLLAAQRLEDQLISENAFPKYWNDKVYYP